MRLRCRCEKEGKRDDSERTRENVFGISTERTKSRGGWENDIRIKRKP